MRILSSLKNKFPYLSKEKAAKKNSNEAGFTLLECILAIGILSSVLASLVALQSSIIYVAQNSMDKLKAVWAMRQAESQLDYIIDAGGLSAIPAKAAFVWSADKRFTVSINKKNLNDIKPSQFLITALKFYNLSKGDEDTDVQRMLAPVVQLIDTPPATSSSGTENTSIRKGVEDSNFINVFVAVSWLSGSTPLHFDDGLFLMDINSLSGLSLPIPSTSGNTNNTNNNTNPPANSGGKP